MYIVFEAMSVRLNFDIFLCFTTISMHHCVRFTYCTS